MAPTATKRSRPAFSPPRPGKTKATKARAAEKTKNTNGITKKSGGRNGAAKPQAQVGGRQTLNAKPAAARRKQTQKRKGAAGTMRALLGEEEVDEDEEEDEVQHDEDDDSLDGSATRNLERDSDDDNDDDMNDDDAEDQEDEEEEETTNQPSTSPSASSPSASSPEPDFILAEVSFHPPNTSSTTKHQQRTASTSAESSTEPTIPLPLIHRIMQSHFTTKTTISVDARALVGKYIEIFVKEGIRRCVEGKRERERTGAGAGSAARRGTGASAGNGGIGLGIGLGTGTGTGLGMGDLVGDSGWLELEDLERIATQLCLDF